MIRVFNKIVERKEDFERVEKTINQILEDLGIPEIKEIPPVEGITVEVYFTRDKESYTHFSKTPLTYSIIIKTDYQIIDEEEETIELGDGKVIEKKTTTLKINDKEVIIRNFDILEFDEEVEEWISIGGWIETVYIVEKEVEDEDGETYIKEEKVTVRTVEFPDNIIT